jgi:hypothetical protein
MRFSLKTFLLTTTLLGAGCGLFVHFKNNNPEGLFTFLHYCSSTVPLVLAVLTVIKVARAGSRPKNSQLLAWGLALGIVPIAIFVGLKPYASGPYSLVSNSVLVSSQYAGQLDYAPAWSELTRRAKLGLLTRKDKATAVANITKVLQDGIAGKTTQWAPGQVLGPATDFLMSFDVLQDIPNAELTQLLELYNGQPTIQSIAEYRDEKGMLQHGIQVNYGNCAELMPLNLVWTLQVEYRGVTTQLIGRGQQMRRGLWGDRSRGIFVVTLSGDPPYDYKISVVKTFVPAPNRGGFTSVPVNTWVGSELFPIQKISVPVDKNLIK